MKLEANWHPCLYIQDNRLYLLDPFLSFRIIRGYIYTPLMEHCLERNRVKDAPSLDFKSIPVDDEYKEILDFLNAKIARIETQQDTKTKKNFVSLSILSQVLPVHEKVWNSFVKKGYCNLQGEHVTLSEYGACLWFYHVFLENLEHI